VKNGIVAGVQTWGRGGQATLPGKAAMNIPAANTFVIGTGVDRAGRGHRGRHETISTIQVIPTATTTSTRTGSPARITEQTAVARHPPTRAWLSQVRVAGSEQVRRQLRQRGVHPEVLPMPWVRGGSGASVSETDMTSGRGVVGA